MLTVLWTTVPHASGTYIAWNKKVSSTTNTRVHHKAGKTNHIDRTKIKPYGPSFKHDRVSYTEIFYSDCVMCFMTFSSVPGVNTFFFLFT